MSSPKFTVSVGPNETVVVTANSAFASKLVRLLEEAEAGCAETGTSCHALLLALKKARADLAAARSADSAEAAARKAGKAKKPSKPEGK